MQVRGRQVIEQILADGKVTAEERKELHRAIENALPADARGIAVARRRLAEIQKRDDEKQQRAQDKAQARAERERNAPTHSANFMVAGVRHGGRSSTIRKYVRVEDTVYLARDTKNRYSPNAVAVRLANGMEIGFVPEKNDEASAIAWLLDHEAKHTAFVTKILEGRNGPIPVVQAYLFRPESTDEEAVTQSQVPRKVSSLADFFATMRFVVTILLVAAIAAIVWLI